MAQACACPCSNNWFPAQCLVFQTVAAPTQSGRKKRSLKSFSESQQNLHIYDYIYTSIWSACRISCAGELRVTVGAGQGRLCVAGARGRPGPLCTGQQTLST